MVNIILCIIMSTRRWLNFEGNLLIQIMMFALRLLSPCCVPLLLFSGLI